MVHPDRRSAGVAREDGRSHSLWQPQRAVPVPSWTETEQTPEGVARRVPPPALSERSLGRGPGGRS